MKFKSKGGFLLHNIPCCKAVWEQNGKICGKINLQVFVADWYCLVFCLCFFFQYLAHGYNIVNFFPSEKYNLCSKLVHIGFVISEETSCAENCASFTTISSQRVLRMSAFLQGQHLLKKCRQETYWLDQTLKWERNTLRLDKTVELKGYPVAFYNVLLLMQVRTIGLSVILWSHIQRLCMKVNL